MVTAEAAVVLPVLLVLALACAWLVSVAGTGISVGDAAREGARLAARGEPEQAVLDAVARTAPDGARTRIEVDDELVTVTVSVDVDARVPLLDRLPGATLESTATAALEESGG